ncbi:MAG: DUF1080 domain-containing protein [Bacteroidota bacterium]|nr:DUF1080 domain-containing protein [Bacteroidota bacterium]
MKYRVLKQIPVVLILVAISFMLSTCRPRKAGSITNVSSIPADSTYIFDGKSLNGWEITNFGTQGPVTISDGEIILGMGDGCTGITWKRDFPSLDYEVTLDARRVDGNDFFCGMTFPVGKYPCTLIVGGWGGTIVGLSSINGMDASENETTTLRKFDKDRWYRIKLDVTGDAILAWIDDEKVVDFTIGDNILSIRPEVELSRPFGIASWRTTAAIRNIRVVRLER